MTSRRREKRCQGSGTLGSGFRSHRAMSMFNALNSLAWAKLPEISKLTLGVGVMARVHCGWAEMGDAQEWEKQSFGCVCEGLPWYTGVEQLEGKQYECTWHLPTGWGLTEEKCKGESKLCSSWASECVTECLRLWWFQTFKVTSHQQLAGSCQALSLTLVG